jgi:hypothetical protein
MDLNFEAPLTAYEFAYHILINHANIAIISMAWISQGLNIGKKSEEPDLDTLSHWAARLEPLIQAEDEGEIIIVIANCYGTEEEATYAGTSCVLSIGDGEMKVYGILGHEEQELLVVDTSLAPKFKLVDKSNAATLEERTVGSPGRPHGLSTGERYLAEGEQLQESDSTTTSISSSPLALGPEELLRETLQSVPVSHWGIENNSPSDSISSGGNLLRESSHGPHGLSLVTQPLAPQISLLESPNSLSTGQRGTPALTSQNSINDPTHIITSTAPLAETPYRVDLVAVERSLTRAHSAEW